MILQTVAKEHIVGVVTKAIAGSKKEILATMLLSEEMRNPLPDSYHALLTRKVGGGVVLKRLCFGGREHYNTIKERYGMSSKSYSFRYSTKASNYQRLIIIDRKVLFFGIDGVFFQSSYKPLIQVFIDYFMSQFKKGKV